LEKKKQKTFLNGAVLVSPPQAQMSEDFAPFFLKNGSFLSMRYKHCPEGLRP
jgi:hypothetical protein